MPCKGFLKILMVVFNSLILIVGAVTVFIGALVEVNGKHILGVLYDIKDIPPEITHLAKSGYLLIAVGAVLTIMGFLGCCGACCEDKCMLGTYFTIILIVFVVEVVAAVLFLIYRPKAEELLDKIRQKVGQSIKKSYGQHDVITNAWNETMSLMRCCGYNNYTDFTGSPFVNRTSQYPVFCCRTNPEQCDLTKAASERVEGCFDSVVEYVKKISAVLGGVAICVIAIEVFVMIISLMLCNK